VDREAIGDGGGSDHGVIGTRGRLAPGTTQPSGDLSEAARGGSVKRKRLEIGFGLLEVKLTGRPLLVSGRHKRAYRQFGQGDRRDERLVGKHVGVVKPPEHDERAGIENPARHRSERRIEDSIEVATQPSEIDRREPPAVGYDHIERHRFPTQRSQFGNGLAGAGDDEPLTFDGAVDNVAALVA
jgi:hypothetical protein